MNSHGAKLTLLCLKPVFEDNNYQQSIVKKHYNYSNNIFIMSVPCSNTIFGHENKRMALKNPDDNKSKKFAFHVNVIFI